VETIRVCFLEDAEEIRVGLATCENLDARLEDRRSKLDPEAVVHVTLGLDAAYCTETGMVGARDTCAGVEDYILMDIHERLPN
jgi:hypothetical protein